MDPAHNSDNSLDTTQTPQNPAAVPVQEPGTSPSENQNQIPPPPAEPPSPFVQQVPQPEVPQPQVPQTSEAQNPLPATSEPTSTFVSPTSPPPPSSKKKLVFGIFFLLFLLVLSGMAGLTYAVAYEKIKLDKYPEIQAKVAGFVMALPFTPKTPKYVLSRSALAHKEVTKQSFDISVAVDSDDLASSLGLNTIDALVKGEIDYSDPKNFKLLLNASVTKDFNFELKKADKIVYFRVNKLPSFLLSLLGLTPEVFDPLLGKWVAYDTTPLETEARKSMEDKEVDPLSEENLEENLNKYIDDEVLKNMKLETVTEDNIEMYKISLAADSALIDHIGDKIESERNKLEGSSLYRSSGKTPKLSEMLKKFTWEILIDKKNYYTRKVIVEIDLEVDQQNGYFNLLNPTSTSSSQKSKMSMVLAFKSDKFGEEVVIEPPATS